ncbi:hypothetical protein ABE41_010385 [Fictibacillus arsenicus]|jgi:hypothetical protein|uniref:Uncharacterized protein n=1 Tax=Fictibacillus arsenicus TaxID=255247 RepID=A0A1B1Z4K0_9BACL|nr:hypothetical protein [Fictibacillus arsenicus]ANX12417.1 hypothetical protein ABE41_010385 [Fictibacillus arsenicus]
MNVNFDWNEWFFIITTSVIFSLFLLVRNYFPAVIVIIIWVYNIVYVSTIDYFLLATPFKLYYFSDNRTYELSGALFHLLMYPCASLLFLFGYDKWRFYGKKTVLYILFWTGFSIFFEWICVKNHALTYTGWKLYYSIPTYPLSAILLIRLFHFTKSKLHEISKNKIME